MFRRKKWFIFFIFFISILLLSSFSFAVNTNLTIQDVECYYSEKFIVSVHLTDENGFPLNKKEVKISVDGWTHKNLFTDSNGRVDLIVSCDNEGIWYDVGTHKLSASFSRSGVYSPSKTNGKVIILQMPTKMTMNYDKNKRKTLFYLSDKNNKPAGSVRIDLYINNKYYEYTLTDEYGKGSIDIFHLNPGEYFISANINEFLDNYISDNVSMKIEIKESKSHGKSENSNFQSVVNMKNTGLPIIAIIFSFLFVFSSLFFHKRK